MAIGSYNYIPDFSKAHEWVELSEEFKKNNRLYMDYEFVQNLQQKVLQISKVDEARKIELLRDSFEKFGYTFSSISELESFMETRVLILIFAPDFRLRRLTFCVDQKPLFNIHETRYGSEMSEYDYRFPRVDFEVEFLTGVK